MQVKYIILFTLTLVISNYLCDDINSIEDDDNLYFKGFQKFFINYDKNYSTMEDYQSRYLIFKENMRHINVTDFDTNSIEDEETWKNGLSPFADLTPNEFNQTYLREVNDTLPEDIEPYNFEEDSSDLKFLDTSTNSIETGRNLQSKKLPSKWDWREKGAVTNVKHQGICGCCWAFSAVGNIEGLYFKKYKNLVSFSEQHLLDCNYMSRGCNGGTATSAFKYLIKAGGLMMGSAYKYKARKSTCKFKPSMSAVKIKGITSPGKDENKILQMLYKEGPLAVAINAKYLQFYRGGVLDMSKYKCNPSQLNHAVTLVGYGSTSSGVPYWIAKNSWGSGWGESGYFRIRRGKGVCGINMFVTSAILK
jgi:cathepsin F